MVDQADLPTGHQAGKRWPCRQLKPPAERAQEVDKSIDADRAAPDHYPVAFPRRADGKAARDGQISHGSLQ